MAKKTLLIIRHAHRSKKFGSEADNGLSAKGWKQAKAILKYYKYVYGKRKPHIVSSPKVRCVETVDPIAKHTKTKVHFSELLLEQRGPKKAFEKQIADFYRWWKTEAPQFTIACSHGDWIPKFFELVSGGAIELDKGGWAELEFEDNKATLRWILQDLDR